MEQILQSLSLGSLLENFQGQRMEPQTVLDASDQELIRLGVCTIGDRIRLRDACKKKSTRKHLQQVMLLLPVLSAYRFSTHGGTTAVVKHESQQEARPPVPAEVRGKLAHGLQPLFVWQTVLLPKRPHLLRKKFCSVPVSGLRKLNWIYKTTNKRF